MKTLTLALLCMITLLSCNRENMTTNKPKKGPTKILGKVTIVNSDIPVNDIDVYIWKYSDGIFPTRELVDEAISDSNGNFELIFDITKPVFLSANFGHTSYLSYRQLQDNEFNRDGKVHPAKIEMIPPAWVNVRMVDKGNIRGYDMIAVGSEQFIGGGWNIHGPKDSTILVKVYGNMRDTISFGYWDIISNPTRTELLKSLKFPVFVPPFQVQDMTIEY